MLSCRPSAINVDDGHPGRSNRERRARNRPALVVLTTAVAPALQIGFMLAIARGASRARATLGRHVAAHHPTALPLGISVDARSAGGARQIADYATVIPDGDVHASAALIFLLAAMQSAFDPREVWQRLEWAETSR
jgi:hypothetical protein